MSEGNNTTSAATIDRHPFSPDLWVPYVLIGASCVTFLTVHFWCYHKRNRERYIRQRDEKRVKSGLMERRRITTLILARYQSHLGINPNDTDIDLKQMYFDNCVDSDSEYQHVTRDKYNNSVHNCAGDTTETMKTSEASNTAASTGVSSSEGSEHVSKTISTSRTWPRVSDRNSTPYNAHKRPNQDTKSSVCQKNQDMKSEYSDEVMTTITTIYNNSYNTTSPSAKLTTSKKHKRHPSPVTSLFKGNNQYNCTQTLENAQSQLPLSNIYQTSSPTNSCSSIFCTNISSPSYSTQYSQTPSSFKRKHSKRRYDGAIVKENENFDKDKYRVNYLTFNKLDCSRIDDPRNMFLISDKTCEARINVCEDTKLPCVTDKLVVTPSSDIKENQDTTVDLSVSGSNDNCLDDPANTDHQVIPMNVLSNNQHEQVLDSNSSPSNTCGRSLGVYHMNNAYTRQDQDNILCTETSLDTNNETTDPCIHTSTYPQNLLPQRKNITSTPHISYSINPAATTLKTNRTIIDYKDASTQVYLSYSHSVPLHLVDIFDISSNIFNHQPRYSNKYQIELNRKTIYQNEIPQLGNRQSTPQLGSRQCMYLQNPNYKNNIDDDNGKGIIKSNVNNADCLREQTPHVQGLDPCLNRNTPQLRSLDSCPVRKTPQLRSLDPRLVLHHKQRKRSLHSD